MLPRIWTNLVLALGLTLGLVAVVEAQTPDSSAVRAEPQSNGASEKLNPYTGDEEAIAEGKSLYMKYNCYGCHGTQGGGGMGSALNDAKWAFGGDDRNVFQTIKEGRGQMPDQFGQILNEEQIWKIIAFIRSVYKGNPESVEW